MLSPVWPLGLPLSSRRLTLSRGRVKTLELPLGSHESCSQMKATSCTAMQRGSPLILQMVIVTALLKLEQVKPQRHVDIFPPCIADEDCIHLSNNKKEDYKCFQYMCYPWKASEKGSFRSCKKSSDCKSLLIEEGGDGSDGDCYRHPNRRTVHTGICLDKRYKMTLK